MQRFTLIVFSFCVVACSAGMRSRVVDMTRETLDKMDVREAEETFFQFPSDSLTTAMVLGDRLVVLNHKDKSHGFLGITELYNHNDWTWTVGRGYNAGQALTPLISESQGRIALYDPTLKKLILVDPEFSRDAQETDQEIHTNVLTQRILPVGQRFLYLNQFSFDGKEPRLCWLDAARTHRGKQGKMNHYMNVLNGAILYGSKNQTAVFCSEYTPELELYDASLRLFKKVHFPNPASTFMELRNENGLKVFLVKDRHTSFRSASGGENYFATIYRNEENQSDMVLIFNWNGDLLDGFYINLAAKRVSLGNTGNLVYVWGRCGQQDVLQSFRIECDE